jgi:hypothetical protein
MWFCFVRGFYYITMNNVLQEPETNYQKGYIKLFRSIEDHWLTCNPYYYLAFTKMLIKVNHSGNTFLLEGEIIECKRGQAVFSLDSWSDIFNKKLSKKYWTKQRVRTFFNLLEKDFMIFREGLRKTTRITICNYDSYQNNQHTDNTEITHRQHTDNTQTTPIKELKNDKELKNENNKDYIFNFKNEFLKLGVESQILDDWLKVRKVKKGVNTKTSFNKIKKEIELSKLTANECIKKAVEKNWVGFESEWLKTNGLNGEPKQLSDKDWLKKHAI